MIVSDCVSSRLSWPGLSLAGLLALACLPGWSAAQGQRPVTQNPTAATSPPGVNKAGAKDSAASPFVVQGRVVDTAGKPLKGVEVRANCGMGTLRETGKVTTDADGRYRLPFAGGVSFAGAPLRVGTQVATITPRLAGWCESQLGQLGNLLMTEYPDEAEAKGYAGIVTPGKPYELNFTMTKGTAVQGQLLNEFGEPITEQTIYLDGEQLPPSQSVLAAAVTDDKGFFRFDGVPQRLGRADAPSKVEWYFTFRVHGLRHELKSDAFAATDSGLQQLTLASEGDGKSVHLVLRRNVVALK